MGITNEINLKKVIPDYTVSIQNGGIISVLQTTEKEKEIANYLNWLEGYNLDMRDEIRQGKQIEELKIVCKPKEETLRNDFSQKLKIPQGERNKK